MSLPGETYKTLTATRLSPQSPNPTPVKPPDEKILSETSISSVIVIDQETARGDRPVQYPRGEMSFSTLHRGGVSLEPEKSFKNRRTKGDADSRDPTTETQASIPRF